MTNDLEAFLQATENKELYLFGLSKRLVAVVPELKAFEKDFTAIIDNDKAKWGNYYEKKEIISPMEFRGRDCRNTVILITTACHDDVEKQLLNMGYAGEIYKWPLMLNNNSDARTIRKKRYIAVCHKLYSEILNSNEVEEKMHKILEKNFLVFPRIPVMITTRCTLKCVGCSNLIPNYEKPKDYKSEDIIKWISNFLSAVDECICLELVGGEPFLYYDLEKVLKYVINCDKVLKVEFTTNGTILPNDRIIKLLKNTKVRVCISDYASVVNINNLVKVCEDNEISYKIYKDMYWYDMGDINDKFKTEKQVSFQYLNCNMSKLCRTLLNGKLYVCSRAASLSELDKARGIECVDVSTYSENLRNNIKQFLFLQTSRACNYCNYIEGNTCKIPAGIQMKRKAENV